MADTAPRLNGHAILASNGKTKRKRVLTGKILVPVSQEMLSQVQDYRFANRFNTLSLAVRELIQIGLDAQAEKQRQERLPL